MSSITINRALSIGQQALQPITTNYKNEVLWLLQKCLNINSSQLLLNGTKLLNKLENEKFNQFIKRRCNKEPLQHILESIEFYGYQFDIIQNIFIPRPETEVFVDILKKESLTQNKVLEIGSGAGCIPIILELEQLADNILSIDINTDAIKLSKKNAKQLGCTNIKFLENDIFQMRHQSKYDLIISNPPYIPLSDIQTLETEVLLYDPLNALTDYEDGLSFYRYFAKHGKSVLAPEGFMLFEFGGRQQLNNIIEIFVERGYKYEIFNDLNGEPRFILLKF